MSKEMMYLGLIKKEEKVNQVIIDTLVLEDERKSSFVDR